MHKIVRKHWFGLEIYTKNVIFGLNLPHLPKILDTTKNFQKSGLWSSIFMQKIKKLCWVDPEKGSENTRRDRTYLKGPLQQSWGYNSTTNFWYIDNFLTHKITKKLRNHSDQFLRSTTEEEQNKKNCPLTLKYQANVKKYGDDNFMCFTLSATKRSTVSAAMFRDSKKFSICRW